MTRWPDPRLTDLFGTAHPVVQAGLVYNSGVAAGAADLGLDQDELIAFVLEALVPVAEELGL